MLTRLARLGPTVPRLLSSSSLRFVSQSKPAGAAGSTAVTELHPAEAAGGHGEVNPYVKVSGGHRTAPQAPGGRDGGRDSCTHRPA